MGRYLNDNHANGQQLIIDVATATTLIQTLLKYSANRTRIDKVNNTLTVYEDNGTTPLKVFELRDSNFSPSVAEVAERYPI